MMWRKGRWVSHKAAPQVAQRKAKQSRLYLLLPPPAGEYSVSSAAVSVLPKVHEEKKRLLLFLWICRASLASERAGLT